MCAVAVSHAISTDVDVDQFIMTRSSVCAVADLSQTSQIWCDFGMVLAFNSLSSPGALFTKCCICYVKRNVPYHFKLTTAIEFL